MISANTDYLTNSLKFIEPQSRLFVVHPFMHILQNIHRFKASCTFTILNQQRKSCVKILKCTILNKCAGKEQKVDLINCTFLNLDLWCSILSRRAADRSVYIVDSIIILFCTSGYFIARRGRWNIWKIYEAFYDSKSTSQHDNGNMFHSYELRSKK